MAPRRTGPPDYKARDARLREQRRELADLCRQYDLPFPWGPYRAAPHTCFKCRKRTVVYTWVNHRVRGEDWPPPPKPKVLRRRKTGESGGMQYWANVCAACGITQGDNYLYDERGDQGPPPFRYTWRQPLPGLPGGPVAGAADETPGAPVSSTASIMINALLGRRRGGW